MAMPAALLRLGHRRYAARGAGRRLAGQRMGPEHRHASHPGRRRGRGGRGGGCWTCSGSVGQRRRVRDGRHDGELHRTGRRRQQVLGDAGWDSTGGLAATTVGVLVGPSDTTRSTWRCATSGSAHRLWCRPTTRAGFAWTRWRRRWRPAAVRRSCACRLATSIPARSIRFARAPRLPTARAHGSTSTVRSGCGPRHRRAPPPHRRRRGRGLVGDRRPQDPQRAVRLRHRDRRRPAARCMPPSACARSTYATRWGRPARQVPNCRVGHAASRCGPPCAPRPPGVAELVAGWSDRARINSRRVSATIDGVEVLNDVVFTQVCIALEDDAATEALSERLLGRGRGARHDRRAGATGRSCGSR